MHKKPRPSGPAAFLTFDVKIAFLISLFDTLRNTISVRCVCISLYRGCVIDFVNSTLLNMLAFSLKVFAVRLLCVNVSVRRYFLALQYCRALNTFSLLFSSRKLFYLSYFDHYIF